MTKILISMLAVSALGIGVAACSGDDDDDGNNPVFSDPAANTVRKDRMGRPAINTIIRRVVDTDGTSSDAFNSVSPPADAAAFEAGLQIAVGLLHACPPASLGSALLPDVLTFNAAGANGYLNGRDLDDDVIDLTLRSVYSTNGGTTFCVGTSLAQAQAILTDNVDANDSAFLTTFPYLAAPH